MTEFTAEWIKQWRFLNTPIKDTFCISALIFSEALDEIEHLQARVQELETQLKSKDIIINNQQGRLNYYATKDLLGGNNERNTR